MFDARPDWQLPDGYALGFETSNELLLDAGQCLAGMMDNGWFAGMVIMLFDGVHRVGGRGAGFVDARNGAVTYGAAVVPGYRSASG